MATYTTVPDDNLQPDKPARSVDALALRDNPIAIAEGASGAPRVDPELAWRAPVASVAKQFFGTQYTTEQQFVGATYKIVFQSRVWAKGVVRVRVDIRATDPGETAYAATFINGVLSQEVSTTSTTHVTFDLDTTVAFGDKLSVRVKDGGTFAMRIQNLKHFADYQVVARSDPAHIDTI